MITFTTLNLQCSLIVHDKRSVLDPTHSLNGSKCTVTILRNDYPNDMIDTYFVVEGISHNSEQYIIKYKLKLLNMHSSSALITFEECTGSIIKIKEFILNNIVNVNDITKLYHLSLDINPDNCKKLHDDIIKDQSKPQKLTEIEPEHSFFSFLFSTNEKELSSFDWVINRIVNAAPGRENALPKNIRNINEQFSSHFMEGLQPER